MYIIKNALRNILRSKGRTILIGCIAFIIGLSACLALSIRQAAVQEKTNGLANLQISASIRFDRQQMMEKARDAQGESGEKPDFKEMMGNTSALTLEEMQTYAKAKSVQEFDYTLSVSLNAGSFDAITNTSTDTQSGEDADKEGNVRGKPMENQGDLTLIGYSSYSAMPDFTEQGKTIQEGELFAIEDENTCIIHEELATMNDLSIGDTITLVNPENEKDTFKLTISGIYTSTDSDEGTAFGNMAMMDPANQIYASYATLQAIQSASAKVSEDTALNGNLSGTYRFASVEDYESFEEQARALGLSEEYTISSSDITAYEQRLTPLENLSTYAGYFLIVILVIGGAVLIMLHMYHIRERKYEIGVLAAIGMNKKKIAAQFICEIFIVTMLSVLLASGIGTALSVPVTNTLLASQTTHDTEGFDDRPKSMDGAQMPGDMQSRGLSTTEAISSVSYATNGIVFLELAGIAIVLTILAGGVSVFAILRYDAIRILSEREG